MTDHQLSWATRCVYLGSKRNSRTSNACAWRLEQFRDTMIDLETIILLFIVSILDPHDKGKMMPFWMFANEEDLGVL